MTKLKIANLYYDIMNLYGENANIRALVKFAEYQGIQTEVHNNIQSSSLMIIKT